MQGRTGGFATEGENGMTVIIDTRIVESSSAKEVYISAVPDSTLSIEKQAEGLFSGVREKLLSMGAVILQERVFAAKKELMECCLQALQQPLV